MEFIRLFSRDRREALQLLDRSLNKIELLNQVNASGWNCVHFVSQDGDVDSLLKLKAYGADLWYPDINTNYPLLYACRESNLEIVRILLDSDISGDIVTHFDNLCSTVTSSKKTMCCSFHTVFDNDNIPIAKELCNKFFPLFRKSTVERFVYYALGHYSLEMCKVLGEDPSTTLLLQHSRALSYCLMEDEIRPMKLNYILEIGTIEYPLDFTICTRLMETYVRRGYDDGEALEVLIRHHEKLENLNSPILLYYAITSRNEYFVDVLLAIGCDPYVNAGYSVTCICASFMQTFEEQYVTDFNILKKLLMYSSNTFNLDVSNIEYEYEKYEAYVNFMERIVYEITIELTLFEILYYNAYLWELEAKLKNRTSSKT